MADCAFGPFRLDARNSALFRGSEPVALGRRAVALLHALAERPGAIVSKNALIEAAWPGLVVEESNLSVQITAIRRVLREAPGGDRWIETMPRRGYRFIGPVVSSVENDVTEPSQGADVLADGASSSRRESERRQITVLSCELVSTVKGASGKDLEDLHEAVGVFQRCVTDTIDRWGGFVARFLGNSALVLFGYPEAHEHDAEQAVRAGRELCATVRALGGDANVPMRSRVGIATGVVIIGEFASAGAVLDHQIVGDAPNVAVRLQISVPPDTVTIDAATRRLIGNLFDCHEAHAIEATNGTEPARVWQVLDESVVESRFEALHGSALSPLIGRGEEIDLLLRRWARARAGCGQIVLMTGEAGIGKSRLVAALEEQLHTDPHFRLSYFCSPYHRDSALFPVVEQLNRAACFTPYDTPALRLDRLKVLLARARLPNEDIAFIADLMSLASDHHTLLRLTPQRKKQRTLQALIRQLEGLASRQPVVVIFEDAHWIDPTSRELLDLFVERIHKLPALLIVTFRPEFQPPWAGQPQITSLVLNRLDWHDRTALAEQIAGKALPGEVARQIGDRTDGVPLFVEELTKNILESGLLREEADRWMLDRTLPTRSIPTTLHALLLARLDRLGTGRRVAQIGAAIGRQFSYGVLRAVSHSVADSDLQTALARLVASELVVQRGTPPDAVYSFKHALVQDAAQGSLLRQARQRLHGEIAEALEIQFPDVVDSQPEVVAQHYEEAGCAEKALAYWTKAADRSVARSALAEAAAQFQKGLEQLALLPDNLEHQRQELELRSALGAVFLTVKGNAAPETGQAYARALELWQRLGSPPEFLHVPWGKSRYHICRGEFDLALRLAKNVLRMSRERNDIAGLLLAHYSLGHNLLLAGRFAQSRRHLEEVLALYDPIAHQPLVRLAGRHLHVNSQALLGLALFCLGYPDQAVARSGTAIAEARRLKHPPSLANALANNIRLLSLVGDMGPFGDRANELSAMATEQGFPLWHALGTTFCGWAKVKSGYVKEGMDLLCSGSAAYRATGAASLTSYSLAFLARALEFAGQLDEAVTRLDEALEIVARTGERLFAAELYRHKGQLMLRQGNTRSAEELYRDALRVARKQQAKLWELRAAACLAQLLYDHDRRAEARELFAPVYAWFSEGSATPDLREARALLDTLGTKDAGMPGETSAPMVSAPKGRTSREGSGDDMTLTEGVAAVLGSP